MLGMRVMLQAPHTLRSWPPSAAYGCRNAITVARRALMRMHEQLCELQPLVVLVCAATMSSDALLQETVLLAAACVVARHTSASCRARRLTSVAGGVCVCAARVCVRVVGHARRACLARMALSAVLMCCYCLLSVAVQLSSCDGHPVGGGRERRLVVCEQHLLAC
jgi:hypothetical protein